MKAAFRNQLLSRNMILINKGLKQHTSGNKVLFDILMKVIKRSTNLGTAAAEHNEK